MSTIFTKIIKGEIPSYKVAEDEDFYAFLDINPMSKGHTLVVPKIEVDYIFDLPDDLLAKMTLFAKKVSQALSDTISCQRIGMMVIGLEVPHAHIHLIPIVSEMDMNLSNKRLKFTNEEMTKISNSIQNRISTYL